MFFCHDVGRMWPCPCRCSFLLWYLGPSRFWSPLSSSCFSFSSSVSFSWILFYNFLKVGVIQHLVFTFFLFCTILQSISIHTALEIHSLGIIIILYVSSHIQIFFLILKPKFWLPDEPLHLEVSVSSQIQGVPKT